MKLTAEQRIWIERQLVPACHEYARASYADRGVSCPPLGVTAGVMMDSDGGEFGLVVFWMGIDDVASEYVESSLEERFPDMRFTVMAEW